jgi:hypothetical protein
VRTVRIVVLALLAVSLGLAQTITSTSPLPGGTVNVFYSVTLTCTNCTNAVWGASGNIPPGLGINSSSGTISGTPTAVGTFNFVVTLTLPGTNGVTKPFSLTISAPPLSIQNTSFPNGRLNTAYPNQTLSASGGVPPYSWSATNLPPGLNVSGSTLGGTPTAVGTFRGVTLTVTDSVGTTASAVYTITINAGTLTINNTGFPNGTVGVAYPGQTLSASGGVPPYFWSVSTGLPPGLGLSQNGTTYTIVGTPTNAGTYSFILTVSDSQETSANMQFQITIANSGPGASINTTSLPNGTVNQPYTAQLICTNCVGYVWSISSGTLPLGLTLSGQTGTISGTPTTAGTSSFQVSLTPAATTSNPVPITQILSITINQGGLTIVQTSLPIATQGSAYSTTLTGMGGTTPYTWSFSSTSNDGLSIAASTGVISGTPASSGQFFINVTLTDSFGLTATKPFTLTVAAPLTVLTTSLPNGSLNTPYPTQTISAGGGQPPYRWIVVTTGPGNLPPGLTLDGVFGRISGTPTASGTFPFQLMVTDNNGLTATGSLSITIGTGGSITIAPATLPGATVGTAYSQTLTASGGQAPYTFAIITGSLPVGLTLNATTGVISGTPTLPGSAGFTVQATDSTRATGQAALSIAVTGAVGPVTITTTSLPDGTVGTAYSQTVAATGGTTPYTFSITTGTLPAGLTLDPASGTISGTPTAVATSSFTVTVTDSASGTAKQALTITTAVALTVTPTTLPAAVVGTAYTQKFTAAGGKAPYTFALTGTLPAGFTFTAATATITGTAPSAESGSFTITVTDASSRTVTLSLTLTATVAPLSITPTTLPNAMVGVAYTQKLTAAGGVAPYTFALTLGNLPNGFTFNAATATISGSSATAESSSFTITVTDSAGAHLDDGLTLTVTTPPAPTVTVSIGGSGAGFMQQLPVTVAIGAAYPVAIQGAISLTFAPSVTPATGVADGMIQFASGGTSIPFTIPTGNTTPTFANGANPTVLTGTTAGTITVTTSLTANGVALSNTTKTIVNAAGVPFISNVSFQQTPGGITVTVVGFSSTRDMVSGLFHFAPASNVTLSSADITVPLATAYSTWWSNTAQSNPFGTQFTLTMPFSLSTQSTAVVSVTVTLTNSKGASNAVTLSQ